MRRSSCSITEEESRTVFIMGDRTKWRGKRGQNGDRGKYQRRLSAKWYFGNGESSLDSTPLHDHCGGISRNRIINYTWESLLLMVEYDKGLELTFYSMMSQEITSADKYNCSDHNSVSCVMLSFILPTRQLYVCTNLWRLLSLPLAKPVCSMGWRGCW